MHFFKQALIATTLLITSTTEATPILNINEDGKLTGASNVEIKGISYNVNFEMGFCSDLFAGCNSQSDFTFNSIEGANAASKALSDSVISPFHGEIIWGNFSGYGFILTPYEILPDTTGYNFGTVKGVGVIYTNEYLSRGELFDVPRWTSEYNFSTIWAKWQRSEVPEPSALGLLLLGISTLFVRINRANRHSENLK